MDERDGVSWNAIISGYCHKGESEKARRLFDAMSKEGIEPGTFGAAMMMGPNVIKSLPFHMTKKKHGPYGEEQGTPFTTKLKEGKIVGIHGRNGLFLDALGVHAVGAYIFVSNQGTPRIEKEKEGRSKVEESRSEYSPVRLFAQTHATEGKVNVETETQTPLVTNTPNNCTAIIPKEPAGAITEVDNPHWSNKLLMTNRGKAEEVACGVLV
ncbi:unnamed protein product [Prunus armeniaca]